MDRAEVTERLRADAWNLLYDLERNVRYYRAKSAKVHRNSLLLRFFLLTGVVVEVVLAYRAAEYSWGLGRSLGWASSWRLLPYGMLCPSIPGTPSFWATWDRTARP